MVLHGFRYYDSHLLIEGFEFYKSDIYVIPSSSEKYISIICITFVFLDSTLFLNASLATLVSNLKIPPAGVDALEDFEKNLIHLYPFLGLKKLLYYLGRVCTHATQ